VNNHVDASSQKRRVVIAGGGLAGLSAAEALSRDFGDRFDVSLLEAKRMTGGRAGSFTDPSSGEPVDYCQHVAMGCCTNLIGLLDRCGLDDALHRYTDLQFLHPDHPPSQFAPSRMLPPPLHLAPAIGSLRFLTAIQKRRLRKALLRLMRTPSESLRDQTAAQWLRAQDQDSDTIDKFWNVVLVSALGERSEVVCMSAARMVFVDGFAAARGASDVLVPKQPLAELFGRDLCTVLQRLGTRVRTGSAVSKIHCPDNRLIAVETVAGQRFAADHLISAVPWHAFDALASQIGLSDYRSISQIPSSPITGLHLWFDREITDLPHAVMVGTLTQWVFRQPFRSVDSASGCYYQVVISASPLQRTISKDELLAEVLGELAHAFPAARSAKVLHSRIVTDPQSVFSLSPAVQRLRPPARTPLPWFHLAGDWIDTGWPATMEGAVISGRMAAASVMQSEGLGGVHVEPGLPRGWLARLMIA
jgi:squalene-associated FAD-dependent desaturase